MPRYSEKRIEDFLDNDISGFYDACDRMDAGASPAEGIAWIRETHGERWAEMLAYYFDNFLDSLTGTIPGMRVLVHDIKARPWCMGIVELATGDHWRGRERL